MRLKSRVRDVPGAAVALLMGAAATTTFAAFLILNLDAESAKAPDIAILDQLPERESVTMLRVVSPEPPRIAPDVVDVFESIPEAVPESGRAENVTKPDAGDQPTTLAAAPTDVVVDGGPEEPVSLPRTDVNASVVAPVESPAWRRYAVPIPETAMERPMIALVIDDLGHRIDEVARAVALPGPLTLAFLPYVENLPQGTEATREAGHELLLHLPMEPENGMENPGPNALLTTATEADLSRRLAWNLDRFTGYVGVNNHMGSRFTGERGAMNFVLQRLHSRGLLFLDSRTTHRSVGASVARSIDLPTAERDVFIDHVVDHEHIRGKTV